jgi:hypothetical protein
MRHTPAMPQPRTKHIRQRRGQQFTRVGRRCRSTRCSRGSQGVGILCELELGQRCAQRLDPHRSRWLLAYCRPLHAQYTRVTGEPPPDNTELCLTDHTHSQAHRDHAPTTTFGRHEWSVRLPLVTARPRRFRPPCNDSTSAPGKMRVRIG